MKNKNSIVAVFDFDHTLTNCDSLLHFLFYTTNFWKTCFLLAQLSPQFIQYAFGLLSRQEMKEKVLKAFFKGWPLSKLQSFGKQYAVSYLDSCLKKEAIERLKWHQAQKHRCLLLSASPEFYLKFLAERHGFEKVLGSKIELTQDKCATGALEGLNCWGQEKKRRLLEYLKNEKPILYVYGDSRGDQELLDMADHPFYRKFS